MNLETPDSGRLYEERVKYVSARNKERALAEFIREQRRHVEYYMKEGKKVMKSMNDSHSELSYAARTAKSPSFENTGKVANPFDLPILQHRRIEPLADSRSKRRAEGDILTHEPKADKEAPTEEEEVEEEEKVAGPRAHPSLDKKAIKRREGLSEAEVQRLDDRRERKKVRREIMKPKHDVKEDSKANSKKSKKKGTLDTALMHGLMSTKVGKNRLTLQPLQTNVGVFNRGKISTTIGIHEPIAKKQPAIVKEPSKRTNHTTSRKESIKFDVKAREEHNTSSESEAESCTVNSRPIDRNPRQPSERTSSPPARESDEEKGKTDNRKPYDPADSIVWDIEASNVALKSQVEEVPARRRTKNEGDLEPKVDLLAIAQQSDLSLAPSQSASQVQQNIQGSPVVDQVSRYFSQPRKLEKLQNNMSIPETRPVEDFMSFNWRSHREDPKPDTLLGAAPTSPQKPRSSSFSVGAQDVVLRSIEKRRIGTTMDNNASSIYYQGEDELLHPLSDWSFYPAGKSECGEDVISQMGEQRAETSEGAEDWQAADGFTWEETNNPIVICDDMQCDDWTGTKAHYIWEPIEIFHNQELENNDVTVGEMTMDDIWSSYSPVPLYPQYGDEAVQRFKGEQGEPEDNAGLSVCLQDNHERFSQGKFLLDRVKREEDFKVQSPVAEAETEVAYRLGQGYWYPQKMY